MKASVSVVIVAFQSGPALLRCVRSLRTDPADDIEIIIVDNGGGGPEIEEVGALGGVRLVDSGRNLGFAGGCNRGASEATGDVLVFLNADTLADPGALGSLAATLDERSIGIAMARLRLLDRPALLNSGGTVLHVSGLAWAGRYGEPAESLGEVEDVAAPSGAAMAIRRDLFHELGGFTDELFMYVEATELGWRTHLHGLRVVVDPGADVYHAEYEFGRNPRQDRAAERTADRADSLVLGLILLAPVLAATELAILVLAAKQRWLGGKLGGWWWCLSHPAWLSRHRRETQRLRRVRDRELARFLVASLDPQMIPVSWMITPANRLIRKYWSLIRRLL